MLNKVIDIFNEVKNTSSKKEKEQILKNNMDNKLMFEMLDFLNNPFIVTGIGAKKLEKFADFKGEEVVQFEDISGVMKYLKKHNTGKEEYVKAVANFINKHEGETREFLYDFFVDDMKIGATSTTINKVYGKNTIPKHEVMLAESLTEHMEYIEGQEHITLMKYDGVRCTAVKRDGEVLFLTRKGFPITGLIELEEVFNLLQDNMVYEGELIVNNHKDLKSKDAYRATSKIVRKDGDKTGLSFMAFDLVPVEHFDDGLYSNSYENRLSGLYSLNIDLGETLEELNVNQRLFRVVEMLYRGNDISETLKFAEEAIREGHEGLVVRKADAPYVTKRSKDLLRIKDVKTADLRIVDIEEGKKKSTIGKLGAIVVDYKGFRVNVGGGYSKEERVMLWEDRDSLIGKIVEVIYTEETSNEQGGLSMRFPRFKGVRFDKDDVSID